MTHKQAQIIQIYNENMAEVEDEFLEAWLSYGCPDGLTEEELVEDYSLEDFIEWSQLANSLLQSRAIKEGEL